MWPLLDSVFWVCRPEGKEENERWGEERKKTDLIPTVKQLYRPNSCSELGLREVGNWYSVTQSALPAFPLSFCKPILAAAENSEAGKELSPREGGGAFASIIRIIVPRLRPLLLE